MKRILSALLVLTMVLGLMAGCGGAPADSAPESAAPAPVSAPEEPEAPAEEPEAPAPAPEPVSAEEPSAVEEGPLYEKVAYPLPLFEENTEISLFYVLRGAMGGGYTPGKDSPDSIFWSRVQEKLNVDLVFTEPSEAAASEQYNLMIAGGDMTDLICENNLAEMGKTCAYNGGYDKAIADEVYLDLLDYLDYSPNYASYIMNDPENYKTAITDDGHLPAFYQVYNETALNNMGEIVNTDMIAATGLEVPDTVDGWLKVFEKMSNNGVKYPIEVNDSGSIMQGMFQNAIGATLDSTILVDNATGNLILGVTTDESRQYIELFMDCNEKGWMNPDWINVMMMDFSAFNAQDTATRNAMANEISTYYDYYGVTVEAVPIVHRDGFGNKETAINSSSQSRVTTMGSMVVTTDCRDIEATMKFMDWFYSDEGADCANFGFVEGEVYELVNGQKQINDNYEAKNEGNVQMKNIYTHDGDFGLVYPNLRYAVADEAAKQAYDLWATGDSTNSAIYTSLPTTVALTADESEAITTHLNDLDTYIETTVSTWMCLGAELTDKSWDEFVSTCQGFQLDQILNTYTAAYERYLRK